MKTEPSKIYIFNKFGRLFIEWVYFFGLQIIYYKFFFTKFNKKINTGLFFTPDTPAAINLFSDNIPGRGFQKRFRPA
jgi:hypothetical protein